MSRNYLVLKNLKQNEFKERRIVRRTAYENNFTQLKTTTIFTSDKYGNDQTIVILIADEILA